MAENTLNASGPDLRLVTKILELICGKWRLYIILMLDEQTLRFHQLSERLPEVSEKVLSTELKTLVEKGVLERMVYADVPVRVEYSLSPKGRSALPALRQLLAVGHLFLD